MAFRRIYSWEELYFYNAYLKDRIMNEPVKGNRFLNDVRNIALHMASLSEAREADEHIVYDIVRTLCETRRPPETRKYWKDEFHRTSKWESDELERQLFGAALCTNTTSFIRSSDTLRNNMLSNPTSPRNSCVFGEHIELAAKYGSEELLEYLLTDGASIASPDLKSELFKFAAKAGRIDIVRFLYNFRSEEWPWPFEGDISAMRRYLRDILMGTWNPQVWDFIDNLRVSHGSQSALSDLLSYKLGTCARMNYLDMTVHLVRLGPDAEEPPTLFEGGVYTSAITYAAISGCLPLVELLLDKGADSKHTLPTAVAYGRAKLLNVLLDRGIKTSDSMVGLSQSPKSAQLLSNFKLGPYLDVVRLLLDAGVDVNESIGKESPLACAIAAEHTALFNFLLERGANLHSPGTAEECVRRAKQDGLESMLSLLEQHGVNVKDCSEQAA
ncbi:unnamed protein product [Alternaria alternata]